MNLVKAAQAATTINIQAGDKAVAEIGPLISGLINASIVVGALAAFIFLIIGGFQWITSGGDKTKTESAQKHITNAIVGLIVIAAAFAIINLVGQFLFGSDLTSLEIQSIKDFQ